MKEAPATETAEFTEHVLDRASKYLKQACSSETDDSCELETITAEDAQLLIGGPHGQVTLNASFEVFCKKRRCWM